MRRRLITIVTLLLLSVFGITLIYGCAGPAIDSPSNETSAQIIRDISPEEASNLIQENQGNADFTIIDVRTPEEFAAGYIANAVLININAADFQDRISQLDKSKTYLVYCRSGARSRRAVDAMQEQGFKEVSNMLGGIVQWEAEGYPVIK